jgi:hypothetical protein
MCMGAGVATNRPRQLSDDPPDGLHQSNLCREFGWEAVPLMLFLLPESFQAVKATSAMKNLRKAGVIF